MKIAFVHDWIVHEGGAEAVLRNLIESREFNEAKVFVLFATHKKLRITNYELQIVTAHPNRLNSIFVYFNTKKIPLLSTLLDYRNLMFWFPVLCRRLRKKIKKYGTKEIIISSFAAAKNVVSPFVIRNSSLSPKVTLYLHSPMQYIWENYAENVKKLKFPIKQLYKFAASYLRPWDRKERRYDVVLCNSHYTAELAKQLYRIKGQVQYPSIDKAFLAEQAVENPKEYFVFVGRVQRYVREIDRVIELCNKNNKHLIVIGNGPDMEYAKSLAGPTVLFVGQIADVDEKIAIMKYARGMINLAKESFGMATAEALCLGVPVFGYNAGATPELINDTNGLLVNDKSSDSLETGFAQFLQTDFDRKNIAQEAKRKFFE